MLAQDLEMIRARVWTGHQPLTLVETAVAFSYQVVSPCDISQWGISCGVGVTRLRRWKASIRYP